jgi:hypothetical protein
MLTDHIALTVGKPKARNSTTMEYLVDLFATTSTHNYHSHSLLIPNLQIPPTPLHHSRNTIHFLLSLIPAI